MPPPRLEIDCITARPRTVRIEHELHGRLMHFGGTDEDYATIRVKVTKHLAVLNDHARTILSAATPAAVKEATLGARGVNASGESALTKANHAAMKQREVVVGGETIVCDWHTKLRPHLDRIYFNATTRPRVVVGVFRDHLA